MYHGLGKGWRLASPRLPPLPGGRAGPLLGFPVAKRASFEQRNKARLLEMVVSSEGLGDLAFARHHKGGAISYIFAARSAAKSLAMPSNSFSVSQSVGGWDSTGSTRTTVPEGQ